jgi:polysaccharide biosynthesis/export protein
MTFQKTRKITLPILLVLLLLTSCNLHKRYTYLQVKGIEKDSLYKNQHLDYQVQPADQLYIRVKSLDESVNALFNPDETASSSNNLNSGGPGLYLHSYSIDAEGLINLPVLGKIQVAGLTVSQVREKIQEVADVYLKQSRVEVKLVSFKVSLLGEIKKPGQMTIYQDKANILEAIAEAGDLSYNGNRKNILLMRNTESGTQTYRIDLTDRNLLSSKYYYLQPNDVLYVEPLTSTVFRLRLADYSAFIAVVSSVTTITILLINLTK